MTTVHRLMRLGAILALAAPVRAAAPATINYQGKLTDTAGNPVTNAAMPVVFEIYDAPSGGTLRFSDSQTLPVVNGVFSARIGAGTLGGPDTLVQALAASNRWLRVVVNNTGLSPRQPLSSAPYALSVAAVNWNELTNVPPGLDDGDDTGSAGVAVEDGATAVLSPAATLRFEQSQFSVTNAGGGRANVSVDASSVTLQGNTFNAANRLVRLDASGNLSLGSSDLTLDTLNLTNPLAVSEGGTGLSAVSAGDLLVGAGSAWSRLARGTDGHVLTLVSGAPQWAAPSGGGGPGGPETDPQVGAFNADEFAWWNGSALVGSPAMTQAGGGINIRNASPSIYSLQVWAPPPSEAPFYAGIFLNEQPGPASDRSAAGLFASASNTNNDGNTAIHARAQDANVSNVGVFSQASGGNEAKAIYGQGTGAVDNVGVYGEATGNGVAGQAFGLEGGAQGAAMNYGVRASAFGSTGMKFGVFGEASGVGTNYGVYGAASGGATNWAGFFDGNVWVNGTVGSSSDARLKKDVRTITGALDRLLGLRGVTFSWREPGKHGGQKGPRMGFIAQEVEAVFPDWVIEGPGGMKGLGLIGFEGLAVEAVRELKAENDRLKARLDAVEKEHRAVLERLTALEKANR